VCKSPTSCTRTISNLSKRLSNPRNIDPLKSSSVRRCIDINSLETVAEPAGVVSGQLNYIFRKAVASTVERLDGVVLNSDQSAGDG
jgi:hypothetical protein